MPRMTDVATTDNPPKGSASLQLKRCLLSALAALSLCCLAPNQAEAGPGFLVMTRDNRGTETNQADDIYGRRELRFQQDSPVTWYLFRRGFGPATVLDPGLQDPQDPIYDEDIYTALVNAINVWMDQDSDLDMSLPLFSADGAFPGIPYLDQGPFEAAMDTRNLISFRDPNISLGDGLLFTPIYYYFEEDYEINLTENPGEQVSLGFDLADGDIIVGEFIEGTEGFSDLAFLLRAQQGDDTIHAGDLIETDIIVNGNLEDLTLFPEDPDDLQFDDLDPDDTLGRFDIGAMFTKAIGRGIGLAESHLYKATLSPFYITPGSANDAFLTDPYAVRELSLDDRSGVIALYGGSTGGGIAGNLLEGALLPAENTSITTSFFVGISDQPVFAGRPLGGGPLSLDTVVEINAIYGLTEKDVGPIELVAHDLTGAESTWYFTSLLNPDLGGDQDILLLPGRTGQSPSDYEIPGLQGGNNWYVFTRPRDPAISFINARFLIERLPGEYPNEFFGGVDESAPVPGVTVPPESPENDTVIRGRYIEFEPEFVPVIFTDPFTGEEIEGIAPTGQFAVSLPASLTLVAGSGKTATVGRLIVEADNPLGRRNIFLDTRGRGFNGIFGDVVDIDDQNDRMTIVFPVVDSNGSQIGEISEEFEIISAPEMESSQFGPVTNERAVRVTWRYTNLDSPKVRPGPDPNDPNGPPVPTIVSTGVQEFSIAHLYRPVFGIIGVPSLFVNGQRIENERTWTGSSIPPVIYWDDIPGGNFYRSAVATGLEDVATVPAEVSIVNSDAALRTNLWNYTPGSGIIDGPLNASVTDRGILMKYENVSLQVGESISFSTVVAYEITDENPQRLIYRTVENGFPRNFPNELYADDPADGYPISVGGGIVRGVNIITNTGTRIPFAETDFDGDGVPNDADNCPFLENPGQEDEDEDGVGDVCQGDIDSDGVPDAIDNCPNDPNPDQSDIDQDGIGDVCDDDSDNDGIPDIDDNCELVFNPGQEDSNGNGIGDACDGDRDGDGVRDEVDNCPDVPNPSQDDLDEDGLGDACDPDRDGDGIGNDVDNCPDEFNPDQTDTDGNGIGDVCEAGVFPIRDVTADRLPFDSLNVSDLAHGDLNGDGFLDFVVGVAGQGDDVSAGLINRIYLNEGTNGRPGYFFDATFGANGVAEEGAAGRPGGDDRLPLQRDVTDSVLLFDFDLDGDLDIFFSNRGSQDGLPGGQNRLLINIDVNDLTLNPFADDDFFGDGFFVDVSEQALPGVLNTKDAGIAYLYRRPASSGAKAVDVDGDGDLDLVIPMRTFLGSSIHIANNPITGGSGIDFGYYDLLGSDAQSQLIDTDDGEEFIPTTAIGHRITFGQRILINRRDELIDADGNAIPLGTPDPYLFFTGTTPELANAVFNPDISQDEVEGARGTQRRIDKFWMRDETLGRDGLFGGGNSSTQNLDRMPPGYPDIWQDADRLPGNREDFHHDVFEALVGAFVGTWGPDLYMLHSRTTRLNLTPDDGNVVDDGKDVLLANLDLLDENGVLVPIISLQGLSADGVPDGYYFNANYGTDLWAPALNNPFPFLIGAGEGRPFDSILDNAEGNVSIPITLSLTGTVADTYGAGSADIIAWSYNGGGAGSSAFRLSRFLNQEGALNISGLVSRGQNDYALTGRHPMFGAGPGYSSTTAFLSNQNEFIENEQRVRSVVAVDLDRNGTMDIVAVGDGSVDSQLFTLDPSGGFVSAWLNIAEDGEATGQPGDFQSISNSYFRPTQIDNRFGGLAVTAFDIDNDGDFDILAGGNGSGIRLYQNELYDPEVKPDVNNVSDRSIYADATVAFIPNQFAVAFSPTNPNITTSSGSTSSLDAGDIDRNGTLDLLIGGGSVFSEVGDRTYVHRNQGPSFPAVPYFKPTPLGHPAPKLVTEGFAFGDVSLSPVNAPTSAVRFIDIDGDGDLDVFQANFGETNQIFFNRSSTEDGLFKDNPVLSSDNFNPPFYNTLSRYNPGETRIGRAETDGNGDPVPPELQRRGFPSAVMNNTVLGEGVYELNRNNPTVVYPDLSGPGSREFTQNIAFGDVNKDGRLDIFLCNGVRNTGARNVLLINRLVDPADPKTVSLVDESDSRLPGQGQTFEDTRAAAFVDVNGDGHVDLIVGNSRADQPEDADPLLIQRIQLFLNDGTGVFTEVTDSSVWPFLQLRLRAITIGNFARNGDIPEDIDGNGFVTDKEVRAFEDLLTALGNTTYAGRDIPVFDVPETASRVPVTEVVRSAQNPNDTFVTQRPARFVNLNENFRPDGTPIYDPVFDVILWTIDGDSVYLRNDGTGRFALSTGSTFQDPVLEPVWGADVGDINLDGWLDIVVAVSGNSRGSSARMLINSANPGFPFFSDRTTNEVPTPISTLLVDAEISEPRGNARAVLLFDADGDRDLDLMVGEAGRTFGGNSVGALDAFYENMITGSGYNSRSGVFLNVAPGTGPTISPRLAVTGVQPRAAAIGSTLTVRIFGRQFNSGTEVFFGQGISVLAAPVVRSPEIMDVTIRVENNAAPGTRQIFVFNPDGQTAVSDANAFLIGSGQTSGGPNRDERTAISGWELFEN